MTSTCCIHTSNQYLISCFCFSDTAFVTFTKSSIGYYRCWKWTLLFPTRTVIAPVHFVLLGIVDVCFLLIWTYTGLWDMCCALWASYIPRLPETCFLQGTFHFPTFFHCFLSLIWPLVSCPVSVVWKVAALQSPLAFLVAQIRFSSAQNRDYFQTTLSLLNSASTKMLLPVLIIMPLILF